MPVLDMPVLDIPWLDMRICVQLIINLDAYLIMLT